MNAMPTRPKKEYRPPKLIVYGTIRQLTKAISKLAGPKDGGPNNTKT